MPCNFFSFLLTNELTRVELAISMTVKIVRYCLKAEE